MAKFLDNAGRAWLVDINVAAIKRCRSLLGVDLWGLIDGEMERLAALVGDPVTLVDVLFVLCQDQARTAGVADEDFGRAMRGDAIQAAQDAFLEAYADFFPDPRLRDGLRALTAAGRRVRDHLLDGLGPSLAAIDPAAVARGLSGSSGSSPAPSASTPAPSPSASST